MRTSKRVLLAAGASALVVGSAGEARAQLDIDPPLPNVLLLVDTSGSMEYLIGVDPSTGRNVLPGDANYPNSSCATGAPGALLQNRWATLVTVLTGDINNFACRATPRNGAFLTEYGLGVAPPALSAGWFAPYDSNYFLPFNRLMSGTCTPGPGQNPADWRDWPGNAIKYHDIAGTGTNCASPFTQNNNGMLDTFRDRVRFGMMTFDTLPDASTGKNNNSPDSVTGLKGMWSYYQGWDVSSSAYAQGNPPNCSLQPFEVGARNPAAPPWEGRLIPFGDDDAALADVEATNDHIQDALLSMRPYGATPIEGMLDDASYFLQTDPMLAKNGKHFGPATDPYVLGGCRRQHIILLTDGEPNQNLRPDCQSGNGVCPYANTADQTALGLASLPGNSAIDTYVVGFGVSNPVALSTLVPPLASCTELTASNQATVCTSNNGQPPTALKSCCQLAKIAIAGGTQHAYFADDKLALKQVLSTILGAISSTSTARTVPVFSTVGASAGQGAAGAVGYRFVGQFNANATGALWTGNLMRERFVCGGNPYQASPQQPLASSGDDFAANLNFNDPTHGRKFFTYLAPTSNGPNIDSGNTLRPNLVNDDGLGTYAQGTAGQPLMDGPTFKTTLAATTEALGINAGGAPAACNQAFNTNSSSVCVSSLINWEIGSSPWPSTRDANVCGLNGAVCSRLGAIYHSTPAIVSPPREFVRDDAYTTFTQQQAARPIMLYTATTDGQLHAFEVSATDPAATLKVDQLVNNELWSFFPPYVLPNLLSSYNQQSLLLDGPPVIADVAGQQVPANQPPLYERRRTTATQWSSVLVAGGGTAGGFYYALDVTNPASPKFLWQLSTDEKGKPLFGRTSGVPTIATVTLPDAGSDLKEVAVAIFPGGTNALKDGGDDGDDGDDSGNSGQGSTAKKCKTKYQTATNPITGQPLSLMAPAGQYHERGSVRCWSKGPGRSVTIVRLDSGEVLMSFRGKDSDHSDALLHTVPPRAQTMALASPITGVPVAYPGQTNQVATRAYVGDADGVLWRIDLAGTSPQQWTMSLAWDAYSMATDDGSIGQPIQTPPVVSTNPLGDTVLTFSTGEQEQFTATASMHTRVWSILEKRAAVSFSTKDNWVQDFTNGERVTGPMGVFDSAAFFSTFAPAASGSVCAYGASKVWALDYLSAAPRFPNGNNPPKQYELAPNTIIAGVAVTKTPSCENTNNTTDPYLGSHAYVTNVDSGTYQLVWQKGPGAGITNNNAVKTDGFTGIQSLTLQAPRSATRIDSWATIIE